MYYVDNRKTVNLKTSEKGTIYFVRSPFIVFLNKENNLYSFNIKGLTSKKREEDTLIKSDYIYSTTEEAVKDAVLAMRNIKIRSPKFVKTQVITL